LNSSESTQKSCQEIRHSRSTRGQNWSLQWPVWRNWKTCESDSPEKNARCEDRVTLDEVVKINIRG
jgi:hypothetical protein